jgi:hypothetical protein
MVRQVVRSERRRAAEAERNLQPEKRWPVTAARRLRLGWQERDRALVADATPTRDQCSWLNAG